MKKSIVQTWCAASVAIALTAFTLLLTPYHSHAQCESGYFENVGSQIYSSAKSTMYDDEGNLYIGGAFKGVTTVFGQTLVSNGEMDMYIMKLSPDLEAIWSVSFGGGGNENVSSMAYDTSGNVYLIGSFSSSPLILPGGASVNSAGADDVICIKLNNNGEMQWYKSFGNAQYDWGIGVGVDKAQNVYFSGGFRADINIDGVDLLTNDPSHSTTAAYSNAFIIKFSPDGTLLWAKRNENNGGGAHVIGHGLIPMSDGNFFYSGWIQRAASTLGGVDISMVNNGTGHFFGVMDTSGAFNWIEAPTTIDPADSKLSTIFQKEIILDDNDNIYIMGNSGSYSSRNMIFGNDTIVVDDGVFVLKYDKNGNILNTAQVEAIPASDYGSVTPEDFEILDDGSYLLSGYFRMKVSFDGTMIDAYCTDDFFTYPDGFICKFNASGDLQWLKRFGSTDGFTETRPNTIMKTPDNHFLSTGYYFSYRYDQVNFDGSELLSIPGSVDRDMFFLKFREKDGLVIPENIAGHDSTINKCDSVQVGLFDYPGFTYVWTPSTNINSTSDAFPYVSPLQNTDYYLTLIDPTTSCVYNDTVSISIVHPNYQIAFSASPRVFTGMPPYTTVFTNTTPSPSSYDYLWDFGDGTTSTESDPMHTYNVRGLFDVKLTAILKTTGCTDSLFETGFMSCNPDPNDTTSISEIESSLFSISPNPSNGEFTLTFANTDVDVNIEIFTIDGKMVYNEYINVETRHASSKQISTDLNKGMYFIKISTGENSFATTKKIIIN